LKPFGATGAAAGVAAGCGGVGFWTLPQQEADLQSLPVVGVVVAGVIAGDGMFAVSLIYFFVVCWRR